MSQWKDLVVQTYMTNFQDKNRNPLLTVQEEVDVRNIQHMPSF